LGDLSGRWRLSNFLPASMNVLSDNLYPAGLVIFSWPSEPSFSWSASPCSSGMALSLLGFACCAGSNFGASSFPALATSLRFYLWAFIFTVALFGFFDSFCSFPLEGRGGFYPGSFSFIVIVAFWHTLPTSHPQSLDEKVNFPPSTPLPALSGFSCVRKRD